MKIRTRLRLNTAAALIILFIAVMSLLLILREASTYDNHLQLTVEIRGIFFERTVLRDEYMMHHEERARLQWLSKTEDLRQLLTMAQLKFTDPTDRELLAEIQKDFDRTVNIFNHIISLADTNKMTGKSYKYSSEVELKLFSQLLLKSYILKDNIDRLYKSAYEASKAANKRAFLFIVFLITSTIIITIFNVVVINKDLAGRIGLLREGINIIGSGRLDHRIEISGSDELGDLARMSNEMAGKLQNGFVSIANLELEIEKRKVAEEGLEQERARLQKALDEVKMLRGIVPICSYCKNIRDDKGYWNKVEQYITEHSEALFSHGICPACMEKYYPDVPKD